MMMMMIIIMITVIVIIISIVSHMPGQGGDPTGTGKGGQSIYGGYFEVPSETLHAKMCPRAASL